MDNGKALLYEHIIKTIYRCQRFERTAADADIYRAFIHSQGNEHYAHLSKIKRYLKEAIQYMDKSALDHGQQQEIHTIQELLTSPTTTQIDEVIERLFEIVHDD